MSSYEKQFTEVNDALSSNDYDKALSILEPLVVAEGPAALGMLGVMFQLGSGVQKIRAFKNEQLHMIIYRVRV